MFRFLSEIERQDPIPCSQSLGILYETLLSARSGTVVFIADHDYPPIRTCIDEIFEEKDWEGMWYRHTTENTTRNDQDDLNLSGLWGNKVIFKLFFLQSIKRISSAG